MLAAEASRPAAAKPTAVEPKELIAIIELAAASSSSLATSGSKRFVRRVEELADGAGQQDDDVEPGQAERYQEGKHETQAPPGSDRQRS